MQGEDSDLIKDQFFTKDSLYSPLTNTYTDHKHVKNTGRGQVVDIVERRWRMSVAKGKSWQLKQSPVQE